MPHQSYSTEPVCHRVVSATAVLIALHTLAAVLVNWRTAAPIVDPLVMQVDLAFHEFQLWRPLTGVFFFKSPPWEVVWLCLFLALFGLDLEKRLPRIELLWFYCLAGVGSSLIWGASALAWEDKLPLSTSGAITALVVLSLVNQPFRRFRAGRYLVVPAWALGLLYYGVELRYYAWDTWTLTLPAHLGGAITALLYRQFDLRWERIVWGERNIVPPETSEITVPAVVPQDVPEEDVELEDDRQQLLQLETQVDQVLAKISRAGRDSLTDQEKQLLQTASERYRRRRH